MSIADLELYGVETNGALGANGAVVNAAPGPLGFVNVQLVGAPTMTVTFEGSVDGVNFAAAAMTPIAGGATVTTATAAGIWSSVIRHRYFRARVSAYTSGSFAATIVKGS